MAGTTRTITTSIKLDGEAEFKKQMSSVNSELKTLSSELKLSESEFRGQANTIEALTAKDKLLKDQIEQQKVKVDALTQAVKDSAEAYGDTDKRTDSYRQQLNNAKIALNNLNGDLKDNSKYLDEAKTSSDHCAKSIDEYGKEIKDAGDNSLKFGDIVKANLTSQAIISGVKALANAASEVAGKLKDTVIAASEAGDAIDKGSQKIQVSTDDYQKLAYAADMSGTSIDTLAVANKTLKSKDFAGDMMDAVNAVAAIKDPAERAAKATELFGKKAGQEMLPLVNSGTDGLNQLYKQLEDTGAIMSEDSVSAAAAFSDSLTTLQTAFGGLKNNLAGDFLPSITTIMDGMTSVMSGNVDEGIAMIEQGIQDFGTQLEALGPVAEQALDLIVTVITENFPKIIDMGIDVLMALIDGICKQMPELIPTIVDLVLTITDALLDNIDVLVEAAMQLTVGIATGLVKAIPKLVLKIPDILTAIDEGLRSGILEIGNIGKELVEGLWSGVKDKIEWVKEKMASFGESVIDGLKSFFGIKSPSRLMRDQIGKYLADGVTDGFVDNIDADAMAAAIPSNFEIAAKLNTNLKTPQVGVSTSDLQSVTAAAVNAMSANTAQSGGDAHFTFVVNGEKFARGVIRDFRNVSRANPEVIAEF